MINIDRCIVVFQKNGRQCLMAGIVCVWETKSMSSMVRSFNVGDFIFLIVLCVGFLPAGGSYTSITKVPQIQRKEFHPILAQRLMRFSLCFGAECVKQLYRG